MDLILMYLFASDKFVSPCSIISSGSYRVTVGAPLRIGKHSLVGRTSITNAVQTSHFSNLGSLSINYFTITTMSSETYIAREKRFIETIEVLLNNEYSNVNVCARAKSISRRVLFDR